MAMIHINRSGAGLGTFSEGDVREGLRTGRFIGTDLGWREGMATWQPLSQFPEFAAATSDVPPSPVPPPPSQTAPAIAPAAPESAPSPIASRQGLPWDQRQARGSFNAFFETLQMVLLRPSEAFTAMKREGGLSEPLIYALIGGSFGLIISFFYRFAFRSLGVFAGQSDPFRHFVAGGLGLFVLAVLIVLAPVLVAICVFLQAAILHLCLMLVGGAKQSFETTFRVVCFENGAVSPLMIIPGCGSFISMVWGIIVCCIGLARAHETDTGRALLAVLLPLIVCCGGGLLVAVMFGALAAWGLSQH